MNLNICNTISNYYFLMYLIITLITYILLKIFIKYMVNYKYGIDIHKTTKNKVAEMGGIIPVIISSLVIFFYFPIGSLSILLSGLVGFLDDLYKLSSKIKFLLMCIIGLIVGLLLGVSPFYLIIAILGIAIYSNFTNMLAGFNGLEIGLGVISNLFLGIILLLNNDFNGFNVVMLFTSSYFGLLLLNKYPAKVFPGDVGTLPIGAFLFTIAIWKNLIPELVIIMAPHFIDALLKWSSGFTNREKRSPTKYNKETGTLYVESNNNGKDYLSLVRCILMKKPMKEYSIVLSVWLISILCGILAIIYNQYLKIIL